MQENIPTWFSKKYEWSTTNAGPTPIKCATGYFNDSNFL